MSLLVVGGAQAARADDGPIRKGPCWMDVREGGATLLLETAHDADVRVVATDPQHHEFTSVSANRRWHEVRLEGLLPATRYAYRIEVSGRSVTTGSVTTAPVPTVASAATPVRFAVYGDTRSDHDAHRRVVASMRREAGLDFVLHTGDLVNDGRDEDDWQDFYDDVTPLCRNVPLVPVIGNHDFVEPTGHGVRTYRRYVHVSPDSPSPELEFVYRWGPVAIVALDAYTSYAKGSRDRAWLDEALEALRGDASVAHVFIASHHGLSSSGRHGENEEFAKAGLGALFRRFEITAFLAGHDHDYERGDDDGLKYVVSDGGGAPIYVYNSERPYQLAFEPVHHHVVVDVVGPDVKMRAVRWDGSTIEACGFHGRNGRWHCAGGRSGTGAHGPVTSTVGAVFGSIYGKTATGLFALLAIGGVAYRLRGRKGEA